MSDQGVQVVVVAASDADTRVARELALRLSTPLAARAGEYPDAIELVVGHRGLALRRVGGPVVTARTDLLQAPRAGGADLLHRAVLAGATDVIDATAGLGADAFHLAARGLEVTMIERSGVFASLLADALERARAGEYGLFASAAAARLRLHVVDAREVLPTLQAGVVLLDPMFPASASTAAPKKGMNLFRELLPGAAAPEEEHAQLLMAARQSATRRVVVKRALRSPHLAGVAPSGSLSGRTVRFDLYAPLEHRGSRT